VRFVNSAVAAGLVCGAILTGATLADSVPAAASTMPRIAVTPNPSAPGTATTFEVHCGSSAISAALFGATLGLGGQIPMHPVPMGAVGDFMVTVVLPIDIAPGTHSPRIDCSNGFSGIIALRVNPVPSQGAVTGDGTTSTQTGTPLTGIGLSAIAIGVLAGAFALRRRTRAGSAR
jgi:hypothetical protein